MIRGRFVITRGMDMADRFWRLALCWICIVGLAGANGERRLNPITMENVVSATIVLLFKITNT